MQRLRAAERSGVSCAVHLTIISVERIRNGIFEKSMGVFDKNDHKARLNKKMG